MAGATSIWVSVLMFILWLFLLTVIIYAIMYFMKPSWGVVNGTNGTGLGKNILWSFAISLVIMILIYLVLWAVKTV